LDELDAYLEELFYCINWEKCFLSTRKTHPLESRLSTLNSMEYVEPRVLQDGSPARTVGNNIWDDDRGNHAIVTMILIAQISEKALDDAR
jgi:hypothetical protein